MSGPEISGLPSALPNLYEYTAALFGRDADRDSYYNLARVNDDFLSPFDELGQRPGSAAMLEDNYRYGANYFSRLLGSRPSTLTEHGPRTRHARPSRYWSCWNGIVQT